MAKREQYKNSVDIKCKECERNTNAYLKLKRENWEIRKFAFTFVVIACLMGFIILGMNIYTKIQLNKITQCENS